MPAARAAHSAAPAVAATRTLAPIEVRRTRPRPEPGPPLPRRPPWGLEGDLGERLAEPGTRAPGGRARRGVARRPCPRPPRPLGQLGSPHLNAFASPGTQLGRRVLGRICWTPPLRALWDPERKPTAPGAEGFQVSESNVWATLGFRGQSLRRASLDSAGAGCPRALVLRDPVSGCQLHSCRVRRGRGVRGSLWPCHATALCPSPQTPWLSLGGSPQILRALWSLQFSPFLTSWCQEPEASNDLEVRFPSPKLNLLLDSSSLGLGFR